MNTFIIIGTVELIITTIVFRVFKNFDIFDGLFNEEYYFFPNVISEYTDLNKIGCIVVGILIFISYYFICLFKLIKYILSNDFINNFKKTKEFKYTKYQYIIYLSIDVFLKNYNVINNFNKLCIQNNFIILKSNKKNNIYFYKIKINNLDNFNKSINVLFKENLNDTINIIKTRKGNLFDDIFNW